MTPRDFDTEAKLPRFSLDRRVTVLVLFLTTAVVGAVATMGIPAELIPRGYSEPFMSITVPWQDSPPREVLDKITIPLEEELGSVKGLDRVTSVSFQGRARLFLRFKQGTDMDVAYREVRDRMERAKALFPADVDETFINKQDSSGFPIYMVGIAIDPELDNPYDLIKHEVMDRLQRVDGVASISAFGLEEKEILIELDRERAAASNVNIYELAQTMSDDNFTMASGTVRSGAKKLLLRSMASYKSLEEVENILVSSTVRLSDIASITYAEPDVNYRARVNSRPAVALHILKESEANTLATSQRVETEFEKLQEDPRLAALDMQGFFDQGEAIEDSLSTLVGSGRIGGLIAALVLFIFMRRFRLTMIVVLSIPLSLVIGVTVMYFASETLNLFTLIGLMVCVGLLVDNSVVVAENIHRLHKNGASRRDSCIKGAGEVALAITMSTLTTIVVFLPAALVEGPAQFFLLRLAIPIAVSVAASLIVALVFIPLCVYLTLPKTVETGKTSFYRRTHQRVNDVLRVGYDVTFGRLNSAYNRLLAVSLRRRFELVLGVGVVMTLTIVAAKQGGVKVVGQQEDEQNFFQLEIEFPHNTTLEEANEWFQEAEKVVAKHKDNFGIDGYFVFHRKTFGEMQAWFEPDRESKATAKEVMETIVAELPEKPGMEVFTGDERSGSDDEEGIHYIFVRGEDPDAVDDVVKDLEELVVNVEGVLGLRKSADQAPNEMGLVIDRQKAQHLGANPTVISGVVSYALRGSSLPKYQADGREVPVRVRFQEEDRESLAELANFQVPTDNGGLLPLSALTSTEYLPSSSYIVRRDKSVGRSITVELEEGQEEDTRKRLALIQGSYDLPEGISFGGNRRAQSVQEDLAGLQFALLLSIVFIYLLMGFLFESFTLPMSIIFTIPLSIIGVLWAHTLTGRDVDFLGFVGGILLVGVVVNNGIVLVDYINRLRTQGLRRSDAVLKATDLRFRPIMMTAITTIGGMVPLALAGANSIGISYTSFSLTLIGGMSTATLLTLLVVPVLYTMIDDARGWFSAMFRRVVSGKQTVDVEVETQAA